MGGKLLAQGNNDGGGGNDFADRYGVHPDGGLIPGREVGWKGSKSLKEACPVLAMAQHLEQPIGQGEHQKEQEQRTVKRIHLRKQHSKWRNEIRSEDGNIQRGVWERHPTKRNPIIHV